MIYALITDLLKTISTKTKTNDWMNEQMNETKGFGLSQNDWWIISETQIENYIFICFLFRKLFKDDQWEGLSKSPC